MKKFLSIILAGIIFSVMTSVFAANYIGNSNSKIFHYSSCSSVNKMKSENKISFNSRDEAIQKGYRPCKKCSP